MDGSRLNNERYHGVWTVSSRVPTGTEHGLLSRIRLCKNSRLIANEWFDVRVDDTH